MPYCTACGAEVATRDAFCAECGIKRHEPADEASARAATAEASEQTGGDSGETAAEPAEQQRSIARDSFSFALSYPLGNYEPFLLGSILALVGAVVPPIGLFTHGYAFRVANAAASGRVDPPEFDDFVGLFADGLRVTVALVVLGGGTVMVGASVAAVAEQVGRTGPVRDLALALVGFAGLYVTPAVLTAYAVTGRFPRAFSGRYTGAFATSKRYLEAFAAWVVLLLAATILWAASVLTLVGPAFVSTYASYAFASFWGYQYRAAAEDDVVPAVDRTAGEDDDAVDVRVGTRTP